MLKPNAKMFKRNRHARLLICEPAWRCISSIQSYLLYTVVIKQIETNFLGYFRRSYHKFYDRHNRRDIEVRLYLY